MMKVCFSLLYLFHLSAGYRYKKLYNQETEKMHVLRMNVTFGHAESPAWDPDSHILYWVDVLKQDVHSLNYLTSKHRVKHLDCGEVNVVIPIANSERLVIGCRSKVYVMDWEQNTLKEIANLDPDLPTNVFNEGKCDNYGRLWAGTKGPQSGDQVASKLAAFYKLEPPCYTPKPQLKSVTISNGLSWSLNNSLLYYIDSADNQIRAYHFDLKRGRIGRGRTVLDLGLWGYSAAVPDGMTIDRDGLLWVALFLYGQVIQIDPDASAIVRVFKMPTPRVTSVTWAGAALEDLVVTTSQRGVTPEQLTKSPLAGTIFILKGLGTGGVPSYKFRFHPDDHCD